WPGVTRPGDCQHPVISNDFYPTLAELLKLDSAGQPSTDGVSLAPLLKNPAGALSRDTLYWHYPHYYPTTTPVSAIRHGDWKLLYYYAENRAELFHLGDDRSEADNLASHHPERVKQLRTKLDAWLANIGAQLPTPNPRHGR
ncbi:MAG: DUF4976 domain-containing protein, partial [Planctomycetales bacterium]|nr:DUF4976 domain-containing protein [Planctomycetales bacterium]